MSSLPATEERDFGGAVEFEEAVKQVVVDGTSMRLACREFDAGKADFSLRVQKEIYGAQNMQFSVEVASKLYELLGWALQRQATRQKMLPAARPNGKPNAEAR